MKAPALLVASGNNPNVWIGPPSPISIRFDRLWFEAFEASPDMEAQE